MKIHLANYQPNRLGGGWTASRYLYEGLGATDYDSADIYFITSPTMVSHDEVEKAKADGKKIVLRIDNAVRNSRNRGTGMSRMAAFYGAADLVIFQSKWARDFLEPYLTKLDGITKRAVVILNGVDTKLFSPGQPEDNTYLYVRSSRDEGKQWIMAWYWFVNNPGRLEIVGKFSSENLQWNFDFYNDERFMFMGEQSYMPDVYKRNKYFLYTYLNEAGSNSLLEARASGCEIINVYGMLDTGCAPEYMSMSLEDIKIERMIREYRDAINTIL